MTKELYARLAQNLLDSRIDHFLTVGSMVITYRFVVQGSAKPRRPVGEIEAKLIEIFAKNPDPPLGLLEGLYGIKILNIGNTAISQTGGSDDFAAEFAEKRLTCNDEELESWVLENIKRFPQEARDQIISYHFEKAVLKKAEEIKQRGE